jgi:hypothetical protein
MDVQKLSLDWLLIALFSLVIAKITRKFSA